MGKRPLGHVQAFPAQLIEKFGKADTPNLLFHGDNKDVLAWLLANGYRGKVQLVYIDPPFDSGADYVRKVSLRGPKGSMKVDGETYSLGEQIQYTDIWANDNYLQFMYERLLLLKELLTTNGSLWLQCDWGRSHFLRTVLDEVFGSEALRNEIVWKRTASRSDAKGFGHVHDVIYWYSKGSDPVWHPVRVEHDEEYLAKYYGQTDATGRRFNADNLTASGLRNGSSGKPWRGFDPAAKGLHWKYATETLDQLDADGHIYWPLGGQGFPRLKRYLDETEGRSITSVWDDLYAVNSQASERGDYPTQKPETLLERVLECSSDRNEIVLDCFIGSGTTAVVAQKLGRRWIGADINKGAIQTTLKRLQAVIAAQSETAQPARQGKLLEVAEPVLAGPLGIDVYRVNDYDLQIQHNEAVALACEHLGVQRNRGDRFFDGTRGKQLVKIIPFNHPLSPVDLDVLQQELKGRPDEDRGILLVCLGMEMAAQRAIDEWNAHRKGKTAVNRIEVVELRSDAKYGGFMAHSPAQAKVSITRKKDTLVVAIDDFISPSIVERLRQQAGVLNPKIDDWRAMVDSVMIDPAYDGAVFNVALSDVPEKKTDFVEGRYELTAPKGETTVAVKITDMLGEEVVVTKRL
ncbi:MAG: site-specific DNA-methyltransferase [Acidobacteriota bacterium]|nr:site-specific DNA-methyltransferase [Acidobacteriota bacterium]